MLERNHHVLAWALLGGLVALCAVGQEPMGPVPVSDIVPQSRSLLAWMEAGGWLMYVLAAMSVLAVAFIIYFLITLRLGLVAPPALKQELVAKMKVGDMEKVRLVCGFRPSPLAAVTLAAVEYAQSVRKADPSVLKDIVESEGSRQASILQGRTQYLLDIAVIAPMVGLLGTVLGMLHAFDAVALDLAKAKPIVLAAGVSEALITTAGGLFIGIPAMMFYAYFRGNAARLVSHLETATTEVLTSLMSERHDELPG